MNIREIVGEDHLFVTRMWGFDPSTWGAVTFPYEKTVDRWASELTKNAFVLCFASHRETMFVEPADRGRVFGIYEFEPIKSNFRDKGMLDPLHLEDQKLYRENGQFRWPWMFKAVRAWKFVDKIKTRETLPNSRALGREISTNMQLLDDYDLDLVSQHELVEVGVFGLDPLEIPAKLNKLPDTNYLMICDDKRALNRLTNWGDREVLIKAGIANDIESRLKDFNDHPLANLIGIKFRIYWKNFAGSSQVARNREKKMLEVADNTMRSATTKKSEFYFCTMSQISGLITAAKPNRVS